MSDLIIEKIEACIGPILQSMDTELADLQYRNEGQGWVIRVFIDVEGGVSLDHCAKVSREISTILDIEEVLDHAYHLEVSSPGLERPLKTKEAFQRFIGKKAKVKLHQPVNEQKTYIGIISQVEGEQISLSENDKIIVTFEFENLNKSRLIF
ncbi:MAG: ribosome maturation factor RimP [Desulfotalea sp.]